MLASIYCYCIYVCIKPLLKFFICFFISVMCSKSFIPQHMITTVQVDCTTTHDQESVKCIYISYYAISYYNLKYIHVDIYNIDMILIPNIKSYYCIEKILIPKIQYHRSLIVSCINMNVIAWFLRIASVRECLYVCVCVCVCLCVCVCVCVCLPPKL